MSELKEAITYFEQLLRRFEDAPDETYWGKEHNATTRKMIGIAIDALRRAQPENSRQHALQTGVCPMCEDCPDGCPVETPNDSRNRSENEPMTLEELRKMDGEPVWVVTLDGTDDPRWEIVVSAGKCGIDLICVLNGVETSDYADFDLYNDTWLAYRNKPERSEG